MAKPSARISASSAKQAAWEGHPVEMVSRGTASGQSGPAGDAYATGSHMIALPGGTFWMGSEAHYPEEGPRRKVRVDAFEIDSHTVTNAQYAAFVSDTGYVTVAERPLNPADFPGARPELLKPGSMVFRMSRGPD